MKKLKDITFIALGLILTLLIITSAPTIIGVLVHRYVDLNADIFLTVGFVANILFVIFILFNIIRASMIETKNNETKPSDLTKEILSKKEELTQTIDEIKKDTLTGYKKIYVLTILWYLCLTILVVYGGFAYGLFAKMPNKSDESISNAIRYTISYIVLFMFEFAFVGMAIMIKIKSLIETNASLNTKYPIIQKMINDIFKEEGINKKVNVSLTQDVNASILEDRNKIEVSLGILILKYFTLDEIKSIIYHEIAHFKNDDTSFNKKKSKYINRISLLLPQTMYRIVVPSLPIVDRNETILHIISSSLFENEADNLVAEKNMGREYANAEIKSFGLGYALEINRDDISREIYKTRKWTKEIIDMYFDGYKEFYNKHRLFFIECSKKHLDVKLASHPNVRQRVERFAKGEILEANLIENDYFLDDIDRFFESASTLQFTKDSNDYWESYNTKYENYLKEKENAINSNYEVDDIDLIKLLKLAYNFGEYEYSKLLSHKILEKYPNNSLANLALGTIYATYEFSDECIPYLEKIMFGKNSMFMEETAGILGQYYVITGREEERSKIRELSFKKMDECKDLEDATKLNLNDKLEPFKDNEVIDKIISLVSPFKEIIAIASGIKKVKEEQCIIIILFANFTHMSKEKTEEMKDLAETINNYLELLEVQTSLFYYPKETMNYLHCLRNKEIIVYKR